MSDKFVAISLGWGVQSFTLAAMSALGELPPVDVAIHADTTHEHAGTYAHAAKYMPWLKGLGVRVVTVRANEKDIELGQKIRKGKGVVDIPAFTVGDGVHGQIRRQCTSDWKIAPIRRWLQANRKKRPIELWLGISTDEALRMKPAGVQYITHRWPLIEKRMSRWDCIRWLDAHGLDIPPKSSCVFCPFHNAAAWREMKLANDGDWQKAVAVDRAIRKVRPPYDLFVHPARIPLEDIDMRNQEDRGQLRLWDEECSGICGL